VDPNVPFGSTGDLIITNDTLLPVFSISANEGSVSISGHIIPKSHKISNLGSTGNRFNMLYVQQAHIGENSIQIGDGWKISTVGDTLRIIKVKDKNKLPPMITNFRDALFEYGIMFVQKYKKTRFVRTGNDRTVSKVHNYLKLLLSPTAYNAQTQGTEKNKLIDIIDTVISANPNKYITISGSSAETATEIQLTTFAEVYAEFTTNNFGNDRWKHNSVSGITISGINNSAITFNHNFDEIEFSDISLENIRAFIEHDVRNAINLKRSNGTEELTLPNGGFNTNLKFNTEGKVIGLFNEIKRKYELGTATSLYSMSGDNDDTLQFTTINETVTTQTDLTGLVSAINQKEITIPANTLIDTTIDYQNSGTYIFEIALIEDDSSDEYYWEGNEVSSMTISGSTIIVKTTESYYLDGLGRDDVELSALISASKIKYGFWKESFIEQRLGEELYYGYVENELESGTPTMVKMVDRTSLWSEWTNSSKVFVLEEGLGNGLDGFFNNFYIRFVDIESNDVTQSGDASVTYHQISGHYIVNDGDDVYNALILNETLNLTLDSVLTPDYEFYLVSEDYYNSNISITGTVLNNYSYASYYDESSVAQDKFTNGFLSSLANSLVQDAGINVVSTSGVGLWANTDFVDETSVFSLDSELNSSKTTFLSNTTVLNGILTNHVTPKDYDAGSLLAYNEEDYFSMYSMIRRNQFASYSNEKFMFGIDYEPFEEPYCELNVRGSSYAKKNIVVDENLYTNKQKMTLLSKNLGDGRIFANGLILGDHADILDNVGSGCAIVSDLTCRGDVDIALGLNVEAYAEFSNKVGISGELAVGDNLTISGNILPLSDKLYNLGSATHKFKELYVDEIKGVSGMTLSGHIVLSVSGAFDLGSSEAPFRNLYVGDVYSSSSSLNVGDGWSISTLGNTLRMVKVKDKNRLPPLITNFRDALFEYGILFLQKFKKTTTVNGTSNKSKSKVFNYLKLLLSPSAYMNQTQGTDKNILIAILNKMIQVHSQKYIIIDSDNDVEITLHSYQEVYDEHLEYGNSRWKYNPEDGRELTIKGKKYKFNHNIDEIEFGDLTLEMIRSFMEHDVKNAINVKRSNGGDFVEEFSLENGAFNSGLKFNTEGKIIGTFNEDKGEYETGEAKDFYDITYSDSYEGLGFNSYNDAVITSNSLTGNVSNIKKKKKLQYQTIHLLIQALIIKNIYIFLKLFY